MLWHKKQKQKHKTFSETETAFAPLLGFGVSVSVQIVFKQKTKRSSCNASLWSSDVFGISNMIILTEPTAFDKMLADSIGKLIDLDAITERLLATDCQQCSLFTHEQVKLAFLKWIEHNLDSIEEQPEWFINQDLKHFYRHLPFDDLQEATELREYDSEETYAEMCADMDARINSGELSQDTYEYIAHINRNQEPQPDNASSLEDDFEGTPEQAAIVAIYW